MKFPAACAVLAISVLFSGLSATFAQTDVPTIAREVDRHYNRLRTLEAQFTEIYSGAGVTRQESGTLWLKRPGKMRWEYTQPRQKFFISDGKAAWFYVPGEQQARKTSMKKLEDLRSPLGYLLGKTRLEKDFAALSRAPDVAPLDAADTVLRGVPRFMQEATEVVLEVNPERQIVRIVVNGSDGSTTEYRFRDEQENLQVADSQFHFSPPAGVEVIEGQVGD